MINTVVVRVLLIVVGFSIVVGTKTVVTFVMYTGKEEVVVVVYVAVRVI